VSLNKIMVIGNVGTDPDMRYTPSGSAVTSFRLATNRRYTMSSGEQREETEWFRVTAWNRLAEQCNQYVTKGMRVYAEGRLKSDSWTGNDGQTRFTNEIIANQVVFLDGRSQDGAGEEMGPPPVGPPPGGGYQSGAPDPGPDVDAEDLPW
jgi:single-strand DNA-binding protein